MNIDIECPHCSRRYSVGPQTAGKQVRCKACQKTFLIPKLASEPEPAVPMAELILEPLPAPKPAPSQPVPSTPAVFEPVHPFRPAASRKPSRPKQSYRPTMLEQIASGLLVASFVGNMLHGPPIGPLTWMLEAGTVTAGMVLWIIAMARRRSQVGLILVCGATMILMGFLVFQLVVISSRRAPLRAEREDVREEAEEARSASGRQQTGDSPRPAKGSDRRQTTSRQAVKTPPAFQPLAPGDDTELVGGAGGGPFRLVSPNGEPVVGLTYRMGSWAGQPALSSLEPVYGSGASDGFLGSAEAREGYGLGALEVDAATYVEAVRPVYMRIKPDGHLDPADSYRGEWIGTPSGRPTRTVDGGRSKVIGICGRRAAVLDAVGLVTEKPS